MSSAAVVMCVWRVKREQTFFCSGNVYPFAPLKMDQQEQFRKLVFNEYMADFDYDGTKFAFNTVFYRTPYSYCCCPCAFEHEYLDYLSDDGEITEEIYERVVSNILKGECSHVKHVPKIYVKETFLLGIHIAAAVGTENVLRKSACHKSHRTTRSGIFNLSHYASAALKNKSTVFEIAKGEKIYGLPFSSDWLVPHLYARRVEHCDSVVKVIKVRFLEVALMKENVALLKHILPLMRNNDISYALKLSIQQRQLDIQKVLVDHISELVNYGDIVNTLHCAETVIALNKVDMLETIVTSIGSKSLYGTLNYWLYETCIILQRKECRDIIAKYDNSIMSPTSVNRRAEKAYHILEKFYDACSDDLLSTLLSDPECLAAFRKLQRDMDPNRRVINTLVLQTLFELSLDIDHLDKNRNTHLYHFLKTGKGKYIMTYADLRAVLETLIYENPDTYLNHSAVSFGLKIDAKIDNLWEERGMTGYYKMDAEEHSLFDSSANHTSPFNFVAPLLIESGFPFDSRELTDKLFENSLPPGELAYIRQLLQTPRALVFQCRCILRKHLKGRKLHTFLASQEIPETVRNFILIKPTWFSLY